MSISDDLITKNILKIPFVVDTSISTAQQLIDTYLTEILRPRDLVSVRVFNEKNDGNYGQVI